MTLTSFLNKNGARMVEGYIQEVPQQVADLLSLTTNRKLNVMEIGFNGGHSAELFLQNNKDLTLTSFDLGEHDYVITGKKYIDNTYPYRHMLICGDSRITIPNFINDNKETKFDIIFIDGGHAYEVAKADIENCSHLAHKDTIVILDDTIFTASLEKEWTIGPTRTWIEHLEQNKILEHSRKEYGVGRGMCWGKYIIQP